MRFGAPSAFRLVQVHRGSRPPSDIFRRRPLSAAQFASPCAVPSSGFLTLSTACSLLERAGLVARCTWLAPVPRTRADSTLGVLTLRSVSPFRSRDAFRHPPPSCRSRESWLFQLHARMTYGAPGSEPESPPCVPGTEASRSLARLQGLAPRPELPAAPTRLTSEQAPMRDPMTELPGSLGLWASSGLCPSRPGPSVSSRPPPMRLLAAVCRPSRRKATWPHRRRYGVSRSREEEPPVLTG